MDELIKVWICLNIFPKQIKGGVKDKFACQLLYHATPCIRHEEWMGQILNKPLPKNWGEQKDCNQISKVRYSSNEVIMVLGKVRCFLYDTFLN